MPITYANVVITNNFDTWLTRTNQLLTELDTRIVTAESNAVIGNVAINGKITANVGDIDYILTGNVVSTNVRTTRLTSNTVNANTVTANTVDIVAGDVATLTSNSATINALSATTGTIATLTSTSGNITTFSANTIDVNVITPNNVVTTRLVSNTVNANTVTANIVNSTNATFTRATSNTVNANTVTANIGAITTVAATSVGSNIVNANTVTANIGLFVANVSAPLVSATMVNTVDAVISNTINAVAFIGSTASLNTSVSAPAAIFDNVVSTDATFTRVTSNTVNANTVTANAFVANTVSGTNGTFTRLVSNTVNANIGAITTVTATTATSNIVNANTVTANIGLFIANVSAPLVSATMVNAIDAVVSNTINAVAFVGSTASLNTSITAPIGSFSNVVSTNATFTRLVSNTVNANTVTANAFVANTVSGTNATFTRVTSNTVNANTVTSNVGTFGNITVTGNVLGNLNVAFLRVANLSVTGGYVADNVIGTSGNEISIEGASPHVRLITTAANTVDVFVQAYQNTFAVLGDTNSDGNVEVTGLSVDFATNTATVFGGKVWTQTNDGAGSLMDADMLDGHEGSWFQDLSNSTGTLPNARLNGNYSFGGLSLSSNLSVNAINFTLNGAGTNSVEIGRTDGVTSTPYIDFHSSSMPNDYDVRIIASAAGSATPGQASLNVLASNLNVNGAVVWTAANDGASSGLDSDLLDGQHGTYYRDLSNSTGTLPNARISGAYSGITDLSMTGALTVSNAAPIVRLLDSTANTYSARLRVDANNVYFDSSLDDITFGEVFRFELDTKIGYVNGGKIWTASNDGAGSALDSDLLDGQHGSYYRDLTNSTGTLPNARISGAYDGITTLTTNVVRVLSTGDLNATSTDHGLQIGLTSNINLRLDNNEMMAVNNGATSNLSISGNTINITGGYNVGITGANNIALTATSGAVCVTNRTLVFGGIGSNDSIDYDDVENTYTFVADLDIANIRVKRAVTDFVDTGYVSLYHPSLAQEVRTDNGLWVQGNAAGFRLSSTGFLQAARESSTSIDLNRFTTTGGLATFRYNNTSVGSITVTASATTYNQSSDKRLKTDLQPIDVNLIDQINVFDFAWINEPGARGHGVMAQDADGLIPNFISHDTDTWTDEDGVEHQNDTWGADYSKLTPLLVAVCKDLRTKYEDALARIEQLEAAQA